MATALLQVRIDANIKKQADTLFSKLARYKHGDQSFHQAGKNRAIPFNIEAKSEQEAFYSPKNVAILKARYERAQKGQGLLQKDIIDENAL